jgi:multidrug efflux pump subunit AcrA (membrane-fusion protein)
MKRPVNIILFGGVIAACSLILAACDIFDHDHQHDTELMDQGNGHDAHDSQAEHDDGHGHGNSDEASAAVTHFNDFTELFVEFPLFSVGNESPFAAHLTWLDSFRPVAEGKVRVILSGGDLPDEEFSIDAPSIPGIFRPVAVPEYAGERQVTLVLETTDQVSTHDLGRYTVYAEKTAIPQDAEEDEAGAISYLKEQQWQVEFATSLVEEHILRESIRAVATIKAAADREAEISAPHDGQLARRGDTFPSIGTRVSKGQVLAVVGSQIGRELQAQNKGVSGSALRAPIDGVIANVHATAGSYLHKGQPVFHIIDPEKLWLDIRIPEADVMRVTDVDGAWVSLPGSENPLFISTTGKDKNGRLVAFSQLIDPRTRTAPLILEFNNPKRQLRIGMLLEAHVFTGKKVNSVSVPKSAIVRDSGVPVVYVELGGETFERRVVQPGIRDGQYIEIRSGVVNGERVVSKGAYLVKLAASGPAEAGHGHAH